MTTQVTVNEDLNSVQRLPVIELLKQIGPGIILTGIAIGPGSMTTALMLGSDFGYTLMWLFVPILVMGFTFVYSSHYISLLTGKPIIHAISHYYGSKAAKFVGYTLFISCTFFTIGNITGTGAGMNLILGINWKIGATICIALLMLVYFSNNVYSKVETIMAFLVLGMAIAYMYTLIDTGGPDWKSLTDGTFHWTIPTGSILTVVGFLGSSANITTGIYGTYLSKENNWSKKDLFNGSILADTIAHIIGVVFITAIIMIVGAIVLHPGQISITSAADMAQVLAPSMGLRVAGIVMGVALVSSALAAMMGNTTRSVVLLNAGLDKPTNFEHPSIQRNSLIVLVVSAIIAFLYNGSPTQLILLSNVLTNIATPVAGYYMCRLIIRDDIYEGERTKKPRWLIVTYYISYIAYLLFTITLLVERIPSLFNALF